MKNFIKKAAIIIFLLVLILPGLVSASPAYDNLQNVGQKGTNAPYVGADQYKLSQIIGIVIQAFLSILGVLFLTYMLYAGYHWMTAQGDEEKVTKAKDTIQRAIIGLIVTVGAYAITYFVMQRLVLSGTVIR